MRLQGTETAKRVKGGLKIVDLCCGSSEGKIWTWTVVVSTHQLNFISRVLSRVLTLGRVCYIYLMVLINLGREPGESQGNKTIIFTLFVPFAFFLKYL